MSAPYSYNIETETANGRINTEVLIRAILDAGLTTGGTFEGGEIDGGVLDDTRAGVILGTGAGVGATLTVTWQNALSGSDETDQDSLVNAHTGEGFAVTVPQAEESLGVSSTGSSMIKLTLTPSGPLSEGSYEISASADIRTQAVIANSYARGTVLLDSNELIEHNNPDDTFESFGLTSVFAFKAGDIPVIEIRLEAIGPMNTVEIMNARLGLEKVGP